ncbi:DUF2970 domain-containing protein [Ideonella sp. YS5]|uniref:DUF2970 domain-containing protein n=1 Tax=Ideonella sp. YS5 TaxID=3453714 RepID=UPI003EEEF3D3
MGAANYLRMVLWSFFGIRRRAAAGDELAQAKPVALVAVAVSLTALFGVTLWGLAHLAVGMLGR